MKYRKDKHGNNLSMLGLGCMRFPSSKAETERMILSAIDGGVNFFDTAYFYPGSEKTLGEILAKHNKRKNVSIATKLPLSMIKSANDFDRLFAIQLERLQTAYVDYYLMHSMTGHAQWQTFKEMGIEEWIAKKKESGQIKQVGFSYHGTCDDFIQILDDYPWEICMIQYNYYDENYQAGKKGLKAAAEKGIATIIMEPLLGGRLATGLPKPAAEVFNIKNPDLTPADWAFWWLWNQEEVTVALSGMNSTQILDKNLASINNFRPLTEGELETYPKVVSIFRKSYKINCTGCNYCLPCPMGINIPAVLSAYNTRYAQGYITGMTLYATSTAVVTKNPSSPRKCNQCGKCEKICPQNIPIIKSLKTVASKMEPLPIRAVFALIRKVMGR